MINYSRLLEKNCSIGGIIMAGPIISLDTLNRALDDVRDELSELNLLTKRLDIVDVYLC